MIRGDLHIHSRCSDGSYTSKEGILLARKLGLGFLSFTDHDTVASATEAVSLGEKLGLTIIPGIEISAWDTHRNRKVHILGYGYELAAPAIHKLCDPLVSARHHNSLRQLAILREMGYGISEEELARVVGESPVLYKQHLMKVLADKGIADGIYGSLYHQLFKTGGPAAGDIEYVDAFDALEAIQADGGLAVLAHPGQLDSWDLLPELVAHGLAGIEVFHESHSAEDCRRARELSSQYGLLPSGGSDDHGSLGSVFHMGEVHCPPDVIYALLGRDHPALGSALPLVLRAGQELRSASVLSGTSGKSGIERKDGNPQDLVTPWDHKMEEQISRQLLELFPECRIVGEETSTARQELAASGTSVPPGKVWILDPVDGTTNFIRSGRDYAISLALFVDGKPEVGIVLDCSTGHLYSAVAGKGAKLNGRRLSPACPYCLSDASGASGASGAREPGEQDANPGLMDLGLNTLLYLADRNTELRKLHSLSGGHRASGCASLSLCRVAEGSLDIYASSKLSLWDWAAGILILKECKRPVWMGPIHEPSRGYQGKRFFLAAKTEAIGLEFLGCTGCTDILPVSRFPE